MSKLDPRLQRQTYLRSLDPAARIEVPADGERIRVLVKFSGDVADLRAAGMRVETVIGPVAVGDAELADIARLAEIGHVSAIDAAHPTVPMIHDSVPAMHADVVRTGPLALTGAGVVVGVIDTGIDIFHHAFRKANGDTRILRLWDQTITTPQAGELPPTGYTYGVEFRPAAINAALTSGSQPFRSEDTEGHGTHVAGIAAGNGSQAGTGVEAGSCHGSGYYIGCAPDADLVIVKTRGDSVSDVTAAQYIFGVAGAQPAVINLSMGTEVASGAHDGTDTFETSIDALLGPPGRVMVVCAGNDGDNGTHAYITLNAHETRTLDFTVPPDDKEIDYFEVWYSGASRITATLTAPSASSYDPVTAPAAYGPVHFNGTAGDPMNASSTLNATGNRHYIAFDISPGPAGMITPDTWHLTLQETAGTSSDVNVWIYVAGEDPQPEFVGSDSDRTRTINVPGTANNVICVGSYDYRDNSFSLFSSRGPRIDGVLKPDVCAPGVSIYSANSAQRPHWYCCDCCLKFYRPDSGTSMATPHVTGVVALMLQRNGTLTFDQVRGTLQRFAQAPDAATGLTLPNNDWGHGIVDAQIACANVPPGAAAGGGGGGMAMAALPASPAAYRDAGRWLRAMERRFDGYQLWHDIAALVSTHVDEVSRLIDGNVRVAVTWHRMGGPRLLAGLFAQSLTEQITLPDSINERPFAPALARWLDALERYGGQALRDNVARHRPWLLALPGTPIFATPAS